MWWAHYNSDPGNEAQEFLSVYNVQSHRYMYILLHHFVTLV